MPLPDDLLVNLSESRAVVEALLDNLAPSFAANSSVSLAISGPHICDRLGISGWSIFPITVLWACTNAVLSSELLLPDGH